MLHALYHALLYALWCVAPAAILIPLRILDRPPRNEVTHESGGDDQDRDGDAGPMLAAAG